MMSEFSALEQSSEVASPAKKMKNSIKECHFHPVLCTWFKSGDFDSLRFPSDHEHRFLLGVLLQNGHVHLLTSATFRQQDVAGHAGHAIR
ncbi:unnamed protein product, partial [Larinioides sclopetarius]